MSESSSQSVTRLLLRWRDGDQGAMQELVPLVYEELRRIAGRQMRGERANVSLQPTELVHEAHARLVGLELSWRDRIHFFSMAARTMRRVLIDHARARRAEKRGGEAVVVSLLEAHGKAAPDTCDILDLNAALERLFEKEERLGQVVELHYFGGLSYDQIAGALGVSAATVHRDLRFARAWLRRELTSSGEGAA